MNGENDKTMEKIVRLMRTDDSADAPPDAVKWAKNLFLSRAAAPKKSLLQKITAVLQMDLPANEAVFGERSASSAEARQMFFEAGENAVDLRIAETEKGFVVRGQTLGAGFENCAVEIGEAATRANERGEFQFGEIERGEYNLILRTAEKEIVVEGLKLLK